MTDEPQRRRPSGGGRHVASGRSRAPRTTIPVRPALRRALPTSAPARVAQGVLVVALAGALGGLAAQTSASADPRSGQRLAARAAVTDAAVDALSVAQAARLTAQDATVQDDQVAELEAATAALEDLLADAGVAEVSAPAPAAALATESLTGATDADTGTNPAGTTDAGTTDPGVSGSGSTESATQSAGSTVSPGPALTSPPGGAAEGLLSASGDRSLGLDDAPASSDVISDPTAEATAEPATEATAAPNTEASADPTSEPTSEATAAPNTEASADPTEDTAPSGDATTGASPATTGAPSATTGMSPDDVVVPPVTAGEDVTTTRLRAALQRVVQLSDEVLDTAQEAADREAAEDELAAREAAEQAAAEKAEQEAAEKAEQEAEQEAAERAAWKESLAGYANGQIPSSALCAASFDSDVLLRCDATEDLEALDARFHAEFGEHMTITDSYRSYAGQVSCRARKGSLCAVPGTSNHGTGTAIDLGGGAQGFGTAEWSWLKENSTDHGWEHPDWAAANGSKPEPWHWEYTG